MNANFIRTMLTWAAIAVTAVTTIFGCTTDISGVMNCSASWLSPQWAGTITAVLLILNQLMKAAQGGTYGSGLVSKTVVVSPTGETGTVTNAQIASWPKN